MAYGTYYTMCVRFKGSSIQTDVRRLILGHIGLDGRASMTRQGFHDTAADCPCCPGHLEDPVHYVLLNAQAWLTFGTSLGLWIMQPATWHIYGVAPHTAMKLLFNRGNFADLAGYLREQ